MPIFFLTAKMLFSWKMFFGITEFLIFLYNKFFFSLIMYAKFEIGHDAK